MGHYALDLYRERVPQGATAGRYSFGILSSQRAERLRSSSSSSPHLTSDGRLLSGLLPLTSTDLSAVSHLAYLRRL